MTESTHDWEPPNYSTVGWPGGLNEPAIFTCLDRDSGKQVDVEIVENPSKDQHTESFRKLLKGRPPTDLRFGGFNFSYANFSESILSYVDFSKATLDDADFSSASLTDVKFRDAKLRRARLTKTVLRNVSFAGAVLESFDFSNIEEAFDIDLTVQALVPFLGSDRPHSPADFLTMAADNARSLGITGLVPLKLVKFAVKPDVPEAPARDNPFDSPWRTLDRDEVIRLSHGKYRSNVTGSEYDLAMCWKIVNSNDEYGQFRGWIPSTAHSD